MIKVYDGNLAKRIGIKVVLMAKIV